MCQALGIKGGTRTDPSGQATEQSSPQEGEKGGRRGGKEEKRRESEKRRGKRERRSWGIICLRWVCINGAGEGRLGRVFSNSSLI